MSKKTYYDPTSQDSILKHAQNLEYSTVAETLAQYKVSTGDAGTVHLSNDTKQSQKIFRGKGKFGQYLELVYFEIKPNNLPRPDFEEANLELKVAPLKRLKGTNELTSKERMVLGIIDYFGIVEEDFDSSHFVYKNSELLIVFYIHDDLLELEDLQIDLVDIWRCIEEDYFLLKRDWEKIAQKVREGGADTISEGDTLYLGAATKGETTAKSMVKQPFSSKKARQRAFCFKQKYINYIYKTLSERKNSDEKGFIEIRLIPKGENISLEQAIHQKLSPYYGISAPLIANQIGWKYNTKHKNRYARLTELLLGLDRKNKAIHEFRASGIEMKTIRILANGEPAEAVSFKAIDYCEIVDEEWEDSDFYQSLICKFLFVIYKENSTGEFSLSSFKLWNMPLQDFEPAKTVWQDTKDKVKNGNYGNFIKMKKPYGKRGIAHVRPHGVKGQLLPTPQGTEEPPKSFWFDKDYVKEILKELI